MKKLFVALMIALVLCGNASAAEKAWRYKDSDTDCTALTSGKESDLCYQKDTQEMYKCVPTSGDCDTPAEWILVSGGLSGQTINYVPKADSATTLTPSAIVDVAGNVGIGNIMPAEKLDVIGNVKAYSFISNSGSGSFTSSNADGFGFDTDNDAVNEIFFSSGGRIGINQLSPAASIDLQGEGTTGTALKVSNSTPVTLMSVANTGTVNIGDGTLSGYVTINNSSAGPLVINSTQAYTSNGNIFQLRSNPTGNGPPVSGNAIAGIWFQACSDTATCKNVTGADITAKVTGTWTAYDDSYTSLNFSTAAGSTTRVLRLIINSDGKIGIGPSTTPGALLDINNATDPNMRFTRTDTTATDNDKIGEIEFYNNDSDLTTQNLYAKIRVEAQQTVSTDAAAGDMIFYTTGTSAGGSPIEALRITSGQLLDLANPLGFTEGGTGLTTASDDQVLVSSGTAWVAKSISDCDDSGGNHLNYDTATNAFSCGTTSSGGGGGGTWGSITGTLSAQTDLNTELGLKAPLDSPTFTTFLKLPNSANPTVDAAGKIAVDTSATTGSALRFYGDATYTLPAYQRMSFTIEATTASSDYELGSFPANITIRAIRVFQVGATNVVGGLQECDANGASCSAVDSDITATTTTATDDGSLTNPTIDANDQLQWLTSSVSGTNTRTVVTIYYTYDAVN